MRLIVAKNYEEMSQRAADLIAAQVLQEEDSVLGLATGGSPVGTYDCLAELYREGRLDFSKVTSVNLDEYEGMTHDNPQSYWYFMNEHFYSRVNIRPENTHVPDGADPDPEHACRANDRIIEEVGGFDLQLLGIGPDGHIGFNEPADAFAVGTHLVTLEQSTIDANRRFFEKEEDVPRSAVTMGIGSIMRARRIVLVANGENKQDPVLASFFGPVTPKMPASILQLHPNCTVVLDEAAAAKIRDRI